MLKEEKMRFFNGTDFFVKMNVSKFNGLGELLMKEAEKIFERNTKNKRKNEQREFLF